jgi:hypothetical protein
MLKITTNETEHECSLIIEGMLTEPWLLELNQAWDRARQGLCPGRQLVVDLAGVTVISCKGEELLYQMMVGGAQFVSRGVLTPYLLRQLEHRWRSQTRGCRKESTVEG